MQFSTAAWVNLVNIGYYLAQEWYNPGFVGPIPSAGLNSPYIQAASCGWNGPSHNDAAYDTFDQKVVLHKLTAAESVTHAGWYRVTPYLRLHKTTDPASNPANIWIGYSDAGDCVAGNGCRDVPPGTMNFTQVKPAVLVTNSDKPAGGVTVSWASVVVTSPSGIGAVPPAEVPEADTLLLFGGGMGGFVTWLHWQWNKRRK